MRLPPRKAVLASVPILLGALAFYLLHRSPPPQSAPSPTPPKQATTPVPAAVEIGKDELIAKAASLPENASPKERIELANALARLGPGAEQSFATALVQTKSLAGKAVFADALARSGTSESVDHLLVALSSKDDEAIRELIVRSFDSIPPGAPLETLVSSLVTIQDTHVRDGIIATVSRAANADTVQFLSELFHEPVAVAGQTESLLAALSSIHNSEATTPLLTMLRESGELPLMEASARSLSKIGTPAALQGIADAFDRAGETNPAFRELLLQTIRSVDNPESLPWLETTAGSKQADPAVAKSASAALNTLKAKN